MNPGERLNNQETREKLSREENIKLIEDMPAIPLLIEMGIPAIDIYNSVDDDTVNDLRVRLEERLANPTPAQAAAESPAEPAPAESNGPNTNANPAETNSPDANNPAETNNSTPAEEEGPNLAPPVVPAGVATGAETGTMSAPPAVAENTPPAEQPEEQIAAKPEKKKSFWTRNRRIGAAILAVITTATMIVGVVNMSRSGNPTAEQLAPPAYEQMQEEISYEFADFEGTDYRGLFLNDEGNGYNEDKQSYRLNPETGQWEEETSWKNDISPRVLDESKVDWEAGNHEDAELAARATIYDQLVREPEFLAIVANQLSDDQKTELGLGGITTVKGMEAALEDADTLAKAESAIKDMLKNRATGEFTTFTGNATNYYLRSNNEANIQNDSSNIEAARTATREYNNVDVFIIDIEGSYVIFDIDCLNVIVLVKPGTPEDKVEPGTPIITIDIDDEDPDPDTGSETGTETGNETGNEAGDETGNETGDGTGNETGGGTGTETGTGTGTETGDESGGTGPETGTEEPPKGDNPHASDPNLGPEDNGGGKHIPDTDLEDADGDAPIITEEEARDANEGNDGYIGTGGEGENNGESGAQLPGSSSGSERVNPGTEGADGSGDNGGSRADTPAEESQGFNGETTDYTEGLETDAAGNQAQETANQTVEQGGGDGSSVDTQQGSNPEGGTSGNYTDSEEESLVQGGNF